MNTWILRHLSVGSTYLTVMLQVEDIGRGKVYQEKVNFLKGGQMTKLCMKYLI